MAEAAHAFQHQLDTRAIEIASATAGKLENMERLVDIQFGHVNDAVAITQRSVEKQGDTIAANHKEVLAAIQAQANIEAGRRASLYGLKDKLGAAVIIGLGGTVVTLAVYIFQHGIR